MTDAQIEAGRIAITRFIKRGGKIWIRVFPDKPITKKPLETRMGKGKGAPEQWVAVIKPGRILYEMEGVPEKWRAQALRLAAAQAADQDEVREARRTEVDGMKAGEAARAERRRAARQRRASCRSSSSSCASRRRSASSTTP